MTFQSVKEMTDAVKPAASILSDRVSVTNPAAVGKSTVIPRMLSSSLTFP